MTTEQPWPRPDSMDALLAAATSHRVLLDNNRVWVLEVLTSTATTRSASNSSNPAAHPERDPPAPRPAGRTEGPGLQGPVSVTVTVCAGHGLPRGEWHDQTYAGGSVWAGSAW